VDWYFRDISNDPSEKELTQQDQFNNDEVVLAEALVRETIQNSTDAGISDTVPVRVRFALAHPDSTESQQFFSSLLDGLTSHLEACGIAVPTGPQKFLIIEDFETTGLEGAIDLKDNGQFCGFWRRFGRSNKKGLPAADGASASWSSLPHRRLKPSSALHAAPVKIPFA